MRKEKSCRTCGFFAELKEPFERSDGAVIYGYCFKDGDKDYSPNMGKGYPVFVDGGGGACKQYKRHRVAIRDQLATNCHQLETVTNRNGLNRTESNTVKVVEIDRFDGCEYCRDSKDIYEIRSLLHDSYNTDVYISENSLVFDIGCHSYGTAAIKFCPMCGRRLEEV